MSKTITSGGVTFMDLTDSRKLDAYITSNLPTTQIYNQNTKTYTPDWNATHLQLSADIYLDSKEVTNNTYTSIVWYRKVGTQSPTQVGSGINLTVNGNQLTGNNGIITYICEATYNDTQTNPPTAHAEIVFTRVDTGLNGSNGQDGTSVTILGSYDTLAELQTAHPTGNAGDAYIIGGNLYVWAVDDAQWENVGNIQGPAGADGKNAKSIILNGDSQVFKVSKTNVMTPTTIKVTAYAFNTTVTNWTYSTNGGQTFLSTVPTGVSRNGNIVTITGSTITSNSIVIKASDGEVEDVFTIYKAIDGSDGSKGNDGAPAPIAFLTNENVTFSANAQGQIATTTITSNIVAYNGTTKVTPTIGTITGVPTGMTITPSTITASNEIMLTITIANNSTLGSTANNMGIISIPVINPVSTVLSLTWSKVNSGVAGVGVKSTTVTYGVSDSASTKPTDIEWQSTIPIVEEGKYLWTRTIIDYTDDAIADTVTYTYSKQGIKGDTGSTGSSVTVSSIQYQEGASATIPPTSTWSNSVVAVDEGKFLWTKTAFSDGKTAYGVAKQGVSGKDGVGINSITVDYGVSDSATVQPTTWQQNIPVAAEGKYLWTRTITDYTDTSKADTVAYVYAKQGAKGDTGSSGSSVTVKSIKYQAGTSATTAPTGTWSDSIVAVAEGNYLWTQTTFSDNKVAYGVAKQGQKGDKGDQGIQGPKGNDAYTVILTNESHIFAGDISNAIAGTAETQVLAYNGSTAQSVTIISVNGKTATTTDTDTGVAGLKFKCSALSGTNPKITFTCTTAFVSKSGSIPIVLSVGGVQFTKMFTYSIAFKGSTGIQGATGQAGTSASLVDITPSAHYFKSTTGKDGTFTPDYIYLYPRFQTVTFGSWQYSINGGTTWVAASGANGISISTYNSIGNTLRLARTSTLYTDTVTSISFRCVSSNASVYDTVSIAKIYDVVDLQIGGRNYIQNSSQEFTKGVGVAQAEYLSLPFDLTPIYEECGIDKTYTLSFDLRSKDITQHNKISVYPEPGAPPAHKYAFPYTTLTVTEEFKRYSITFVPTRSDNANAVLSRISVYGTYDTGNIPVIRNLKLEIGNKATDWSPAPEDLNNITFQIYAPNGYLLTNELQSISLQTFAYEGSLEIASGATFQWSQLVDDVWTNISGATNTTLTVTKADVLKAKSYRCIMTYKGKSYTSTITVQDKTDTYNSIMCISSNAKGSECYWVLYTLVYSDTSEIDPLLGPISISAPASPVNGDYWYAVDSVNATVQLKKYNGTTWANSTDKQSLTYLWNIVNDGSVKTPIGGASKVQVVSCRDFTATATLMCDVSNESDGILTQSSLSITDASDPIVSQTEPTSAVDGQIWIKPNTNGAYNMFVWSEAAQTWIASDMDTRNKVYTSKPSSYSKGDIWITESNTVHSKYLEGTLLQSSQDSTVYNENDWSSTLKYDKDIEKINSTLYDLSQYVTITSLGLKIGAVNSDKELSPFTSLFTSTELAFYQNSDKLLTLANNQLTAPRIVVEEELEVDKKISLGNLQITIEGNGSFSFAVTK